MIDPEVELTENQVLEVLELAKSASTDRVIVYNTAISRYALKGDVKTVSIMYLSYQLPHPHFLLHCSYFRFEGGEFDENNARQ